MAHDESDDNVISLDARRRSGAAGRRRSGEPTRGNRTQGGTGRDGPTPEVGGEPVSGRLVWLYCPTCRTLEYTEVEMAGGRTHNPCGTQVMEAPVEMDLRAEMTLARINLARLELLESVVAAQRQRYEEYAQRLNLAARRPLAPYAVPTEETDEQGAPGLALAPLPDAEVDALGLLVTPFFRDPTQRFPELAGRAEGADDGSNAEPDSESPPREPPDA